MGLGDYESLEVGGVRIPYSQQYTDYRPERLYPDKSKLISLRIAQRSHLINLFVLLLCFERFVFFNSFSFHIRDA